MRYPSLLREIKKPPPLLFVRGNPAVLSLPQIAMVGSRHATPGGLDNARRFAADMAASGVTITSGLALGIDVAAHQGALEANGNTVAVIGTGIDQIYPARHAKIADEIVASGGAIVSEFPIGTKAPPSNFPQRNRIIGYDTVSLDVLAERTKLPTGELVATLLAMELRKLSI